MFEVEFSSAARRFLKGVEKDLAARLIARIELLASDPFPKDVKRVVNRKERIFRVRVGDYRIQYSVIYEKNLIFISDVDHRARAYD